LQADFEANQEKLRKEMLTQFKLDMESTKNDLDQKYTAKLQQEMSRQQEKYKSQISDAKKKQWVSYAVVLVINMRPSNMFFAFSVGLVSLRRFITAAGTPAIAA